MASLAQSIYLNAPRWLQNTAISAYGFKEYQTRYGAQLPVPYDSIASHRQLPYAQIKALQNARLQKLVTHAGRTVPYYRDLFASLKLDPAAIDIDNFTRLVPVLEKATLVGAPERFVSTELPPKILKLFTSGTSGSPLPIVCTQEARATNYAYFKNMLNECGSDVRQRSATFAGRILFSERETSAFWRSDSYNRTLILSSYHITEATLPKYVEALEQWQPEYIDSYPSAIAEIARFINERGLTPKLALKFVLTSSETLSLVQREHITRAFNCPILDHYGCTEVAVSAYSKGERYSVEPLYSLVEFESGNVANSASLICTGLLNMAMPLLRYKIGDSVDDPHSNPAQPFYNQTFAAVIGREDDMVITPDNRRIGRLDPAFKGLTGIRQAQIIQTELATLEVLVVPDAGADQQAIVRTLTENLLARTSREMTIVVRFVDAIPLSKSGKFKSVISRIKR